MTMPQITQARERSTFVPTDPLGPPSDSSLQLLRRARAGDSDALDLLFARHLPSLHRWARGRLPRWARDVADTADIVQDTLIHTFRRLGSFEPRHRKALQAYLRQAVLNRIRSEYRRAVRRQPPVDVDTLHAREETSPLNCAIKAEEAELYTRALLRLRPGDREAIVARLEMGYSYDQLAFALDKPSRDAARVAVRRALLRLAEEMNGEK